MQVIYQSAIGTAYFYATSKYTIIKELPTGKKATRILH